MPKMGMSIPVLNGGFIAKNLGLSIWWEKQLNFPIFKRNSKSKNSNS